MIIFILNFDSQILKINKWNLYHLTVLKFLIDILPFTSAFETEVCAMKGRGAENKMGKKGFLSFLIAVCFSGLDKFCFFLHPLLLHAP